VCPEAFDVPRARHPARSGPIWSEFLRVDQRLCNRRCFGDRCGSSSRVWIESNVYYCLRRKADADPLGRSPCRPCRSTRQPATAISAPRKCASAACNFVSVVLVALRVVDVAAMPTLAAASEFDLEG